MTKGHSLLKLLREPRQAASSNLGVIKAGGGGADVGILLLLETFCKIDQG